MVSHTTSNCKITESRWKQKIVTTSPDPTKSKKNAVESPIRALFIFALSHRKTTTNFGNPVVSLKPKRKRLTLFNLQPICITQKLSSTSVCFARSRTYWFKGARLLFPSVCKIYTSLQKCKRNFIHWKKNVFRTTFSHSL